MKVCREEEITEGTARTFELGENTSVLIARYGGIIYALENVCSHDGADLESGDLIEGQIECPRHGARFDVQTGEAMRLPAVVDIETFETRIEDGIVIVAIPE